MRILVTGGNGQLAQSLVKVKGVHELVLCDLPEGDITSADAMWRLSEGVDAIVNCAAWTGVDSAEDDEDKALLVNGLGAGIVASTAALRGIPMVHISTDYVFDGSISEPLTEDATPNPLGAYGRTKLAGEQAVRASRARAAIVRTSWLYSEFGNNFVKTMLRVRTAKVVNDQHGCPTYAPDLARAILMLLENEAAGDSADFDGTWHFCGAGVTTWFDFAREIFAQVQATQGEACCIDGRIYDNVEVEPISTAEWGARAPRPVWSVLSCAKIAAAGIPVPDWRSPLKECITALTINH